jgi:hypothetical protein
VFACGGRELTLRRETLDLLAAPAVPPTHGFYDACLKGEVEFSLGFAKPCENWQFGSSSRSFGAPGAGGSMGFADPDCGVGYAYVTSQMGTREPFETADVGWFAARVLRRRQSPGRATHWRRVCQSIPGFSPPSS